MNSAQIRESFLTFFQSKGHKIVASAPIVVKDDPTLMFTNAGMNQFKDFFLGNKISQHTRVANSQKCLRVSGKHNDLEEVGLDTYHHTMFEMLGNWSFGDYFKEDAINWAWELLTDIYKLPKDRLYVTIFEGDKSENIERDTESFNIWKKNIAEERILNGNKKDNFWEMGDTGPCGPCSEIHIDIRPDAERKKISGDKLVNNDHPLVIEIWNLVFMQFNRKADGKLEKLPATHVDTGMGFERLCMAIQGKHSNYDTDVFTPMINLIAKESGNQYGTDQQKDIAMRVMADHIRAVAFAIADGQLPSNNKAGYVIRRILRRAIRYGFTFLGFKQPLINKLVPILAEQFKDVFPELYKQQDLVQKVVNEEEISFLRTLDLGLKKLDELIKSGKKEIDGKTAFELYDTYGFPLDLTQLIARENNLDVDEKGFSTEMETQKSRSKESSTREVGDWIIVYNDEKEEFIGYDYQEAKVKITRYREVKAKDKTQYQLVLNFTPFYPEGGGQIGDSGTLKNLKESIKILNTVKENDLIIHIADKVPQNQNMEFEASVDAKKRALSSKNHSATHLLHAALKQVLGNHVQQKGSLVNDEYLRFDFSHFSKIEDEQITEIENLINKKIRENIALDEKRNVPLNTALNELGATALFGEKYGDTVRVICFDKKYSVELCGGTHVKNTSEIGILKILHETGVAAGVRRIEAITSKKADEYIKQQLELVDTAKNLLNNPKDLLTSIKQLQQETSDLKKRIEAYELEEIRNIRQKLLGEIVNNKDINYIISKVKLPTNESLRQLSFDLRKDVENLYLVLAAEIDKKPQISIMFADNLVSKGFNAGDLIKELSKEIQGGGGGQAFFATAGGKNLEGLDKVVKKAKERIES